MIVGIRVFDNANFRTSKHADDVNKELMEKLGAKTRYEPARFAIARSLALGESAPPIPAADADDYGKPITGRILFGEDDLPLWIALMVEREELINPTVAELQELVRRHWHRGILLLHDEWAACGEDYDKFILQIAGRAGVEAIADRQRRTQAGGGGSGAVAVPRPIRVPLGVSSGGAASPQKIEWVMNGPGTSPHIAVMGKVGSGKTRTAMPMLQEIRRQAGCPVILFDMAKGDLAADRALVEALGAEVVACPAKPLPLDVLYLARQNYVEATNAAMRFRESFASVSRSKPGGVQLDLLREAAQRAYMGDLPIKITDVRDSLQRVYHEQRKKPDVVVSTFNDLTSWTLFEPKMPPAEFFARSWVIDLHEATETAQRFVVFLILDALYSFVKTLPDSALDAQGHRAMRLALAIDEARRVLGYGQQSLINLIRESRSKGVSVTLISQSPDDYDSEDDNFLENMGLTLCFNTNATSTRPLRTMLGQAVDLAGLPVGVAVTRLPERNGLVYIKTW